VDPHPPRLIAVPGTTGRQRALVDFQAGKAVGCEPHLFDAWRADEVIE
jgi:hypothetical protein